ncbi:MAG: hypothetical protein RR277_04055 [Rikenellaceae bacterium]
METQNNQTILSAHSKVLYKQINYRKASVSFLLLLMGVSIAFMASSIIKDTKSALYMTVVVLGIAMALFFLFKMLFFSREFMYAPTQSEIKDFTLYFNPEELQNLINSIETGSIAIFKKISDSTNSGVRLDILLSDDHQFAACQIYKYVPYNYEAASDVYTINENAREKFCKCIKELGNNKTK